MMTCLILNMIRFPLNCLSLWWKKKAVYFVIKVNPSGNRPISNERLLKIIVGVKIITLKDNCLVFVSKKMLKENLTITFYHILKGTIQLFSLILFVTLCFPFAFITWFLYYQLSLFSWIQLLSYQVHNTRIRFY